MKQTLKVASIGMIVGFAVALANANENHTTGMTQEPGTAGSTTSGSTTIPGNTTSGSTTSSDTTGSSTDSTGTTTAGSTDWKNMKSCTDQNGVTFRRGEKGFSKCQDWMKKNRKDNMSGTMGSDTYSTDTQTEDQAGTLGSEDTSDTGSTSVFDSNSATGTGSSTDTTTGSSTSNQ